VSERTVRVLLFGGARECAGLGAVELPVAESTTVAGVAAQLLLRVPALRTALPALRFAVNGEYARAEDPVSAGDEVAVIPPVAGGC